MFNLKQLKVKKIKKTDAKKTEVLLEDNSLAIAYAGFTPEIRENDLLLVNTTAVDLNLGSGGYHFVLYNLSGNKNGNKKIDGHIMKMRYTPLQFSILSVESPESKYHDIIKDKQSIEQLPVMIGSLHSQLAAAVATAKHLNPQIKISYIMTDGGSLPIALSNTVASLKQKKLIDKTITIGQSFGGDYEAINIYSGLICAKYVARADIVFVSMGPGVAGTSTLLGNTAIEIGEIVNAVSALDGKAIVIPRLSFKDKRKRHQGISHHALTALKKVALKKAMVLLPILDSKKQMNFVSAQIKNYEIDKKHDVQFIRNDVTEKALKVNNLMPTTMGRGFNEEREFFLSSGCAAIKALKLVDSWQNKTKC